MSKVFLGVGHGGKDPGATCNGLRESDLNLSIALSCNDVLVKHGVTVLMSRTSDENDTLSDEIKECNAYCPDLAVDIHNNAGGGDGAEAYYHYGGGVGKILAENILKEIVAVGQNSRGAKTRQTTYGADFYGFIRETKAPAVIVETAFVDNAKDIQIIDTEAELKEMGIAIAKGILKTLNIEYKEDKNMSKFKDVPETHWAYKAIESLADMGIINGYEDGTFKSESYLTRIEAIVALVRTHKEYDENTQYAPPPFVDVPTNAWYINYLGFAYQKGFAKGYEDGTFKPDNYMTRAEFAVFVDRFISNK